MTSTDNCPKCVRNLSNGPECERCTKEGNGEVPFPNFKKREVKKVE